MSQQLRHHYGGYRPTPAHLKPVAADPSGLSVKDEVDPRSALPPVFDQGQLGSCTANATAAAFQYDGILDGNDPGLLSRLWIYYQERKLENELDQGDTGAYGHDAFNVATKIGICAETDWPYKINTFEGPVPARAVKDERHYVLTKPWRTLDGQGEQQLKAVLSNDQTIAIGFQVYSSFESDEVASTGIMPVPDVEQEELLGGHEVLIVGYLKDHPEHALVRNSWGSKDTDGTAWGLDGSGYFLMPWKVVTDQSLASDLNTIVRSAA